MKKKIANHNGKQRGGKTMAKFFELPGKKRVSLVANSSYHPGCMLFEVLSSSCGKFAQLVLRLLFNL